MDPEGQKIRSLSSLPFVYHFNVSISLAAFQTFFFKFSAVKRLWKQRHDGPSCRFWQPTGRPRQQIPHTSDTYTQFVHSAYSCSSWLSSGSAATKTHTETSIRCTLYKKSLLTNHPLILLQSTVKHICVQRNSDSQCCQWAGWPPKIAVSSVGCSGVTVRGPSTISDLVYL